MPYHQLPTRFPEEAILALKHYVYRLIDPRNGETFYVGEGQGNRIFAHIQGALNGNTEGDPLYEKHKRIREIYTLGLEVQHVIHRHGLKTKDQALEIEAALIDAYPGLSNLKGGAGSDDFGARHAREIILQYQADEANLGPAKIILISIGKTVGLETRKDIYDCVSYAWALNISRARRADYVLATANGLIKGAYRPNKWMEVTHENGFPIERPGRYGFTGDIAEDIWGEWVGKRVPIKYAWRRGNANPVRYTYK